MRSIDSTRRKRQWSGREKVLFLGLVGIIALGHFGTFFKVNKQVASISKPHMDDGPTQWDRRKEERSSTTQQDENEEEEEEETPSKTTKEETNDEATSDASTIADKFYQHHKEQMIKLFENEDAFIVWYTRSQKKLWQGLWEFFPNVYRPHRNPKKREPNVFQYPYYQVQSLCDAAKVFAKELQQNQAIPHVAFVRLDENWGALSEEVVNKTTDWTTNLRQRWKKNGCPEELIHAYLDHPYVRAIFTTQFQIMDHPKVHSLPLGIPFINYARRLRESQLKLSGKASDRTKLLMINHKSRPFRDEWANKVMDKFQVNNTYGKNDQAHKAYLEEMVQSKFILSPGGLGMDTYRHYESMQLGTIPIIESLNRTDGWHRTLADLPVAWIDSYENLTPEFLEQEYSKLLAKSASYKYEKLTRHYWIDFIKSHLENVDAESLGPPYLLPEVKKSDDGEEEGEEEKEDEALVKEEAETLGDLQAKKGEEKEIRSKKSDGNDADRDNYVNNSDDGDDKEIKEPDDEQMDAEADEPKIAGKDEDASEEFDEEQVSEFYSYHRDQVLSLVNTSSAIIWNTRAKPGFMPLYDAIGNVHRIDKDNPDLGASPFIFWGSICQASKAFSDYRSKEGAKPLPHVLFFRMNENWGGFSEAVPGKTTDWVGNLPKSWKKEGCTKESIWEYLDHPDTRAAFTVQFQSYSHPKVYSIPLGIAQHKKVPTLLKGIEPYPPQERSQLLMINHKPRPMRDQSTENVIENFGGNLRNTYGKDFAPYFYELSHSKFILSPGGLGFDCYRHWEAIAIGTIPVLETLNRQDTWFKVFDDLPVAWIDHYENLTPEYLEKEYQRIISKAREFKYEKLTRKYWADFVRSHVADVLGD